MRSAMEGLERVENGKGDRSWENGNAPAAIFTALEEGDYENGEDLSTP